MSDQAGSNPFNRSTPDYAPETPQLEDVIRMAMRSVAMDLRVALPCMVTAVRGNQVVDVQPLLKAQYVAKGQPTTLHPIPNVLVSMPMGQGYSIKLPVAVGDTGLCVFCDRSLDNWSGGSGGVCDPEDGRLHDLMDAIFVPGLVPVANQTQDATQDLVLTNGLAQIRLEKTGRFYVGNGVLEVLGLMGQLVANLQSLLAALPTAFVPLPGGSGAATIATLASTVATLSAELQTLEG